jgi:hypothetical protein
MSLGLCDPYIWEDVRSIPNAFLGLLPPPHPCVSNLANTAISFYTLALLLAFLSPQPVYAVYILLLITVCLIPVFMALFAVYGKRGVAEPFRDDVVLIAKPRPRVAADSTFPTDRNPFMNVLLDEIKYNPTRPPAADITEKNVKITLDDFFRVEFTSDPTDVFGKTQSQRQFITMPSTTVPNDQDSYQSWLYKIPGKTCKEGGREACLPGTDGGKMPWLNVER